MSASTAVVSGSSVSGTVLVVDDEADIRRTVSVALSRMGIDTHTAANLAEARELLATYSFDACLTDMRLPDGNGVDFVAEVVAAWPALPIAVITAHGQMSAAVEAMKNGAFDFVSKPVDLGVLRRLVEHAVSLEKPAAGPTRSPVSESVTPVRTATPGTDKLQGGERLVGDAPIMQELRTRIAKVARSNAPVWITGESGTGKELIATLVHANGPRRNGPFVAINCGAIPSELVESELFGHVKGSFTGAHQDKEGLFRAANGGTLFLDEIAELPLHMQVKLLRAVQERSVRPVGAHEEHAVDVRVLSASHTDLAALVDAARFRQDLYYRLNVISIRSPSLRDRRGDIPALSRKILSRLAVSGSEPLELQPDAVVRLSSYGFPGNVRELENVLERAAAMCPSEKIGAGDLELDCTAAEEDSPSPAVTGVETCERNTIITALERSRWNRRRAADDLGMTYRQLRYRITRYGLDEDDQAA